MEVQPQPQPDAALLRLFGESIRPDPRRSVADWAAAERVVTEGAYPGRWRNERAPYLTEPMERASLHSPTRRVSLMGSAQGGKTQVGVNLIGQVLCETPARVMLALPSINSVRMYNRDKLQPMIDATPALKSVVADITERSGLASTTTVKKGARGAQVELVTASSSRDLQSRTVRVVIMEEVSEYAADVGGRGDPEEQIEARTIAWRKRGEKVIRISTPGIKGACRITRSWQEGSQGDWHVPCPHCETMQVLKFAQLNWTANDPDSARYACESCGALIDEREKPRMLAKGRWIHGRPHVLDRHASYRFNALISPFTPWAEVARQSEKAEADPAKLKPFWQQWLGEAWDEAYDLPKAEILEGRREIWAPGRIPPGVLVLTGATDVQGDRLVWAVWGFDRNFGQWLIETGTLEGDPTRPEVWALHDALMGRQWRDAWGRDLSPDVWGIDAGYLSQHVYAYVRRRASSSVPPVRALDGRAQWKLPAIGTPVPRDVDWQGKKIGQVMLWPVGTWDMKSELAGALRLTEQGPTDTGWPPGALRFSQAVDRAWLDELLAEQCVEHPKTGARRWVKVRARNEAWDLAVYARALARQATERLMPEEWEALAARRQGPPEDVQGDMARFWAPDLKAKAEAAVKVAAPAPSPTVPAAPPPPRPRAGGWIEPRRDWL